jgi:DNA-binding CsgD family transcriptional regulator/tetratricopeptide (TPR) repeat protein
VFECLESDVPELLEEVLELGKPFGTCSVQAPRAVASLAHEPRLLQDVQVLGDRRPRDVEVGRDLPGAELVVAHERENLPPPGRGNRFECSLHDCYVSTFLRKKQLNFTTGSVWRTLGLLQTADELERGREAYARSAWSEAYQLLRRAERAAPLSGSDLALLAMAAHMLGHVDEWLPLLERAHHTYAEEGEALPAVRCAFWIGMNLALRGEMGPATGWLGRAQRLLEREEGESVEHGYMLLPVAFQHEVSGDFDGAAATAAAAAEIGERFGDVDLFALAVHVQGTVLARGGRVAEGLSLLDEAMVAVTAGEVSPLVSGIVYCGVILACEEVYDLRRAHEWTTALTRWCEQQPDLVSFRGRCLVHRAQLLRLHGDWPAALEEARLAGERFAGPMNPGALAKAWYLQGEVQRLSGRFGDAEQAYREASRLGLEPQPGLALLRLAQGQGEAATAAIRRAASETTDRAARAGLLPAYVEIMLAAGDVDAASDACRELREIAAQYGTDMLRAVVAQACGAFELAAGDAGSALVILRQAFQTWQELEAPYEVAITRVLVGRACRALGDEDGFALELDAARRLFEQIGAAPSVASVDSLRRGNERDGMHGLTPRELEVLRLVATGKSNREIAAVLVISEHTVARHVQNIFTKLGVASRTAAGAFAFEHDLV